jgi:hypothetical protein
MSEAEDSPSQPGSTSDEIESQSQGSQEWEDWNEEDALNVKCLFSEDRFPTVQAALQHDADFNHFDFLKFRKEVGDKL